MKPTLGHKQITKIRFKDNTERQFCLNCGCEEHEMKKYPTCEDYVKPSQDQMGNNVSSNYCNNCANVMYCGKRHTYVELRCEFFEEAEWAIQPKSP